MSTQKGDFIELKFSGYGNNELFDSNIESDLKKLHPKAKAEKMIIIVGEGMVVKGLDKELDPGRDRKPVCLPCNSFLEHISDLIICLALLL